MPAELNRATEAKAIAGSNNLDYMTALRTVELLAGNIGLGLTDGVIELAPLGTNKNLKLNGSGTGHVVIEAPEGHGTNKLLEIRAPDEQYPGKFEFWAYGGQKVWDFIAIWPKDGMAGTGNDTGAGACMFAVLTDLIAPEASLVKWFVNEAFPHAFLTCYQYDANFHVTPEAITQVYKVGPDGEMILGAEDGFGVMYTRSGAVARIRLDDDSADAPLVAAGVGEYGRTPPSEQPSDITNPTEDLGECTATIIAILDVLRAKGTIAGGSAVNYYTIWDGADDYADIPSVTFPAAAGTLMMRIKLDDATPATVATSSIIEFADVVSAGGSTHYPYPGFGAYVSIFRTSRVDNITLDGAIPLDGWHWFIVRDSAADGWEFLQAEDDGTLSSRSTQTHQAWNLTPPDTLIASDASGNRFQGRIDRIVISSDRWSDAQIQAVIAGGTGASNVVARYEMSAVGASLTDASGNARHAAIFGAPTLGNF
jgi:hypothetical protein